jgi:hypothetical protein
LLGMVSTQLLLVRNVTSHDSLFSFSFSFSNFHRDHHDLDFYHWGKFTSNKLKKTSNITSSRQRRTSHPVMNIIFVFV